MVFEQKYATSIFRAHHEHQYIQALGADYRNRQIQNVWPLCTVQRPRQNVWPLCVVQLQRGLHKGTPSLDIYPKRAGRADRPGIQKVKHISDELQATYSLETSLRSKQLAELWKQQRSRKCHATDDTMCQIMPYYITQHEAGKFTCRCISVKKSMATFEPYTL